jgi:hypothetical protein
MAFIYAQAPNGTMFTTAVYLNVNGAPGSLPPGSAPVSTGSGSGSSPAPTTPEPTAGNPFPPPGSSNSGSSPFPTNNVFVSISPASINLQAGQSAAFTAAVEGTNNGIVEWSLNPNVGSISNGLYSAPTALSGETQVTIMATSLVDPSRSATATVLLVQPVTPVGISLSGGSKSISAGQTAQFTARVSGTSNSGVTWVVSPSIGTISGGLYTAPSTLSTTETITVTAISQADPTKEASTTLVVKPVANPAPATVTVSVSPTSAALDGGQTATFKATVKGSSNTGVMWSLRPSVGTISNGVYQAPATIASARAVTITATSSADTTKSASATVTLTPVAVQIGPTSISLAGGKSATFSATVTGSSNTAVTWSFLPKSGTLLNGVYTAPTVVNSAQQVTITATSVADSTKSATAVVNLTPPPSTSTSGTSTTSNTITLPLEVMGPGGTTASATVTIPSGTSVSGQLQLYLQIHGLEYQTQASVQVNGGSWMPINDTTATYLGHSATFGGIGGGFSTLQLTMNLPAGSIKTGQNTFSFQFNGTNGNSSGFRVLAFNVLASGSQVIPASAFVQDDPSTWLPPMSDAADIQAGEALWKTANLSSPTFGKIQAKCGDCHTRDGRDLRYFNYSNQSIEARAVFHGLTPQQGAQIASYIRTLNVPSSTYARPWNPPYQPGPGMDSRPVSDWAAGAGLDAVVDLDADTLSYVMPGGSTANLAYNGFMNQREIPIMLQLRDWNHWLPTVHPVDSFPAAFAASGLEAGYLTVRSELVPNNPTVYSQVYPDISLKWLTNQNAFFAAVRQPETSSDWNNPVYDEEIYSAAQWMMVKSWEINQEFGLEGMPQAAFGPQAESRAWYTDQAFFTSPFMLKIPRPAPGIGNGTVIAHIYDTFAWYQTQMILNDGNGQALGTWPIDRGYALSYVYNDLSVDAQNDTVRVGTAGLMMEWLAKILQSGNDPGDASPYFLVVIPSQASTWSEVSSAQKVQLMSTWVNVWTSYVQTLTSAQLFTAPPGVTPPATRAFSATNPGSFTGDLSYALPILRYEGVSSGSLNQIASWASGYWAGFNWATDIDAACAMINGNIVCQ